jgi:hypothetical protein
MSLHEKIDLILTRQEQQDKAIINMSSLIMKMQQFICSFHKSLGVAHLQAINPTVYEINAEEYEVEYQRNLNLAKKAKEEMEELYNAIQDNLEINRFHKRKIKITLGNV